MNTIPELFNAIKNSIEQIQTNNKWIKNLEISRDEKGRFTLWIKHSSGSKFFWSIKEAKEYVVRQNILRRNYRTPKFKRHTL